MTIEPSAERLSCSVVVPVRDDEEQLLGLLHALERQSVPPMEVIVIDNGSRDHGALRARERGCVVVENLEPGIPGAAAAGYDRARGDLIIRCDADSRPSRDWVHEHRMAHSRSRPGTVLVTGPGWFALPAPLGVIASILYVGGYMLASGAALAHPPAFGTTFSMRRSWWHAVREGVCLSPDVHDDMDLSFRVRPGEHVRLSSRVGVGMSPRALDPGPRAVVRWRRAARTLRRNWDIEKPWERWGKRLRVRAALAGRTAAPWVER